MINKNLKFIKENEMCTVLRRKQLFFRSEKERTYSYVLLSIHSPSPCKQALWKSFDPVLDVFFLYSRNLDITKYTMLTAFLIIFIL